MERNLCPIEDEELLRVIERHAAELHAEAVLRCLIDTRRQSLHSVPFLIHCVAV